MNDYLALLQCRNGAVRAAKVSTKIQPLGFDSIWGAEYHFDDKMCPNVMQFLTYIAGRASRVKLGSMVMVLPWHDPVRLAEEVSVLDTLCNGRVILRYGAGLAGSSSTAFDWPWGSTTTVHCGRPDPLVS